jgi:hypothetical protein
MGKITKEEAKELNQNFIKTRAKAIDSAIGKKDAISCWFSIEELKEYIDFVEQEGKAKGIAVNGLRIYFGAYAKNEKTPSKSNLSTVFFIPTQSKKNSVPENEFLASPNMDITEIDGLNDGQYGNPPSAAYPQ